MPALVINTNAGSQMADIGTQTVVRPPQKWRIYAAAACGVAVANATWWMQPLLMQYFIASQGWGEAASGLILSVEIGTMAVGSMLFARYLSRVPLRTVALSGLAISIIASFLTLLTPIYPLLLILRALAGLGAAASLMISNTLPVTLPNPSAAFGRLAVFNILFGVVFLGALPLIRDMIPASTPFTVLAIVLVVLVLPFLALPGTMRSVQNDHIASGGAGGPSLAVLLISFVLFMVGLASGIMWAFYAIIGSEAGLSADGVDHAISFSIFTSLLGAGMASIIGERLGRLAPASAALLLLAPAVCVLSNNPGPIAFRAAICINLISVYFLVPFLLGAAAAHEPSGRGSAYAGGAFFFTGAVAPFLGGVLAQTAGIGVVGVGVVAIALGSIAVIAFIEKPSWWAQIQK